MTDIIFRKFKEGDVIAIFPYFNGTYDPATCQSYMRVGQHGHCEPSYVVDKTKLATPEEYEPLLKELRDVVGYTNITVRKRIPYNAYRARKETLRH
jgi:hypothetical protein